MLDSRLTLQSSLHTTQQQQHNNNNHNIRLLKIDKPQLNTEMLKVTYIVQT